jgi:hypothetical protein
VALTQEIIASRLGARRAGVTVAAGALQNMHAIRYSRGLIHIERRAEIESAACECYAVQAGEFKSLRNRMEGDGTNSVEHNQREETPLIQERLGERGREVAHLARRSSRSLHHDATRAR